MDISSLIPEVLKGIWGIIKPITTDDKKLSCASTFKNLGEATCHTIAIFNNGKSAITEDDLKYKPIQIKFPKNILNREIDYRSDENIEIKLKQSKDELLVYFDFLNRGDGFILKIIIDGNNGEFKISGRVINGILEHFSVLNMKGNFAKLTWFLAATGAIVMCLMLYFFLNLIDSIIAKFIISVLVVNSIFIIPVYAGSKWKEWLSNRFVEKEFYNRIISPNYELSYDDIVFDGLDDEIKK